MLDVKIRWNTLYDIVESFINLREYITESLLELNNAYMLREVNFKLLSAFKPIKLAVEYLSRKDAVLVSADVILKFMTNKLKKTDKEISTKLLENMMKRIAKFLNDSSHIPSVSRIHE